MTCFFLHRAIFVYIFCFINTRLSFPKQTAENKELTIESKVAFLMSSLWKFEPDITIYQTIFEQWCFENSKIWRMYGLYLYYLQWFEHLKHDPLHKDVIKTRYHFMEEDSMDVEEATDAAVERRKFLYWTGCSNRVPSQRKTKKSKMMMMMTSERFLGVQTKGCLCYCAFVYVRESWRGWY